jgi:hypothetical protein
MLAAVIVNTPSLPEIYRADITLVPASTKAQNKQIGPLAFFIISPFPRMLLRIQLSIPFLL